MKKALINLIDICLQSRQKAKSDNSLDSDAQAMIDESIRALTELRARAEAEPDTVGVDSIVNEVRDIIDEKIAAALEKVKDVTVQNSDNAKKYLASREAVRDFARALRSTNGANEFRAAWCEKLKCNGIDASSDPEILLPATLRSKIDDLWNSDTNWLRRLTNTGAKRFYMRYAAEDQDNPSVRAYQHTPGRDEGTGAAEDQDNPSVSDYQHTPGRDERTGALNRKVEQEVTLQGRAIEVAAIYKLQRLDNLTIFNDDGALIEWIADELMRQVYYTIGRAIIVGNADSSYPTNSFIPVVGDSTPYVSDSTITGGNDLIDEVVNKIIAPIYDGRDVALFMGKSDLFALRKYLNGTGATSRYASIDEIKGMLGVSDIITVPYLNSTTAGAARMVAMHLDRYYTVGRMQNFEYLRFPDHLTNSEYFRVETFAGGAAGAGCAAVLRNEDTRRGGGGR